MTINLKYVFYAVLAAISLWCGTRFYSLYSQDQPSKKAASELASAVASQPRSNAGSKRGSQIHTNSANGTNNLTATLTKVVEEIVPEVATNNLAALSNELASAVSETNASTSTNMAAAQEAAQASRDSETGDEPIKKKSKNSGRMLMYFGGFIFTLIGLGVLVGHEVTQVLGSKTIDFLFNEEGEGIKSPEYELAEQVWVNGKPLEAIQMMRDYLKKYPQEIYVAIRIAEIYEKDLQNFVAASLEYEEILKHKFRPDRWGWAAIHLCNVYSKMGQQKKAVLLLERIVAEHGTTPAAKKARKRLSVLEGLSLIHI